jgi:hypothetical protein
MTVHDRIGHKLFPDRDNWRLVAATGLTILALALSFHAYRLIELCIFAVQYPYGLDYAEGLIWEHMRLFDSGRAYAPIDGSRAILFPYPPVYYLVVDAMGWLTGLDGLAAGRAVSMVALLLTGVVGGAIVYRIAAASTPKSAGLIPAGGACLILLSTWPVLAWAPLMRVDMLALCFSLSGVYFSMVALDRPRWVVAASVCFLLAVFTKQILIAAPAASFLVLLLLRPKTGLAGISICLVAGLALLAALGWWTDGGAIRHLFAGNVSRIIPSNLGAIGILIATHSVYVGIAAFTLRGRISAISAHWRGRGAWADFRARLSADRGSAMSLVLIIYFALATPMLLTIVKAGATMNYLLEWTNIVAIFCGLSLSGAARMFGRSASAPVAAKGSSGAAIVVSALAVQSLLLPNANIEGEYAPPSEAELRPLSRMVQSATKPIVSDDMAILVRNGKELYIEPALIGEGSRMGFFDQRPLLKDIQAGKFSFFITDGVRGDPVFDSRYSVEAADALNIAYPRKLEIAGRTIHLPPAR